MSDNPLPQTSLVLYQTEDGRTRIQCRFEDESLWLTQAQIAELFQTTPQNVTLHLKAIFAEGELTEGTTCKEYLQVRQEGRRAVRRSLRHYNLPAILAVEILALAADYSPSESHVGMGCYQNPERRRSPWISSCVAPSFPAASSRSSALTGYHPRRRRSPRPATSIGSMARWMRSINSAVG